MTKTYFYACLVLALFASHLHYAQDAPLRRNEPANKEEVGPAKKKRGKKKKKGKKKDEAEKELPVAEDAVAQMDSEANALFMQAQGFAREGKYGLVCRLLDEALDMGVQSMASMDGENYLPTRNLAIALLSSMPRKALESYRLLVDPIAERRLKAYRTNLRAEPLREIYDKQFLSSFGDDAAYALACTYLDQHRFGEARRILKEILTLYPDSGIKQIDILPRLALACLRSSDLGGAEASWLAYGKLVRAVPGPWAALETELRAAKASRKEGIPGRLCAYGDFSRSGRARVTGGDMADPLWLVKWVVKTQPESEKGRLVDRGGWSSIYRLNKVSDTELSYKARQYHWRPTPQVVFTDKQLWLGSYPETFSYDLADGQRRWEGMAYSDVTAQPVRRYYSRNTNKDHTVPQSPQERRAFANRLSREISIIDSQVYRIEGNERANFPGKNGNFIGGFRPVRTDRPESPVGNVLTAFDRETGEARWSVGREIGAQALVVVGHAPTFYVPEVSDIAIDGKLEDWRDRGLKLDLKNKSNPKDFSSEVFVGWNKDGLMVRAKITDNKIYDYGSSYYGTVGDGVSFFLSEFRGSWNIYKTRTNSGANPRSRQPKTAVSDHRRKRRPNAAEKLEVKVAHGKLTGGYIVEALFPWKNLGLPGKIGTELALQVAISDSDGYRSNWLSSWHRKRDTLANPTNMHTIHLADERGRVHQPREQKPAKTVEKWNVNRVRFLSAPVEAGGHLIVPMEDDLGMNLIALTQADGIPVWKTRVTSRQPASAILKTGVYLTVVDTLIYFANGQGHIGCVDAADGRVMWLARYDSLNQFLPPPEPEEEEEEVGPAGEDNAKPDAAGIDATPPEDGMGPDAEEKKKKKKKKKPEGPAFALPDPWEDSLVLCDGNLAAAMPSDSATIHCFQRITGRRLWRVQKPEETNYALGIRNGHILLAGGKTIAAIEMKTGELAWKVTTGGTTGRGVLVGDQILMPAGDKLWSHAVDTGELLRKAAVQLPDSLLLGNLHMTAQGLVVATHHRLFGIGDARDEVNALTARIEKDQSPQAFAKRGQLLFQVHRYKDAFKDLKVAYEKLPRDAGNKALRESIRQDLLKTVVSGAWEEGITDVLRYSHPLCRSKEETFAVSWALAQSLEEQKKIDEAAAIYVTALTSGLGSPLLSVPGAHDARQTAGKAVFERLTKLRPKLSKDSANAVDNALKQALTRAKASGKVTDLVNLAWDIAGTPQAKEAIVLAADKLVASGAPGAAVNLLQRLDGEADEPTRRQALLQIVKKLAEGPDPFVAARLITLVRTHEKDWKSTDLDTMEARVLKPAGEAIRAPLTFPFRKAWAIDTKAKNARLLHCRFDRGLMHYGTSSGIGGTVELKTGKILRQVKLPAIVGSTGWKNSGLGVIAVIEEGKMELTDMVRQTKYGSFPLGQEGAVCKGLVNRFGVGAIVTDKTGGTISAIDLIGQRVVGGFSNAFTLLGNAQLIPCRVKDGEILLWKSVHGQENQDAISFDYKKGAVRVHTIPRNNVAYQRQLSIGGERIPYPVEVKGLEITKGQLIRRDLKNKRVIWQTPASLKVEEQYQLSNDLSALKTANGGLAIIRLSDGKVLVDRTTAKFPWRRVHRGRFGTHFYYYAYIPQTNLVQLQMGTYPSHMVCIDMKTKRIVYNGKFPDNRARPNMLICEGVFMARTYDSKVRAYLNRLVGDSGKYLSESLPFKKDLKPGENPANFQIYMMRSRGILFMYNSVTGSAICYVAADRKNP